MIVRVIHRSGLWTRFGIQVVGEPFVERMRNTAYAGM